MSIGSFLKIGINKIKCKCKDDRYASVSLRFLAYKFALSTVLYQTVRDMMIGDSETFYDTEEKVYNDLSKDE